MPSILLIAFVYYNCVLPRETDAWKHSDRVGRKKKSAEISAVRSGGFVTVYALVPGRTIFLGAEICFWWPLVANEEAPAQGGGGVHGGADY